MKTLILTTLFAAQTFAATPAPAPTDESRYNTLEAKEVVVSYRSLNGQPVVGTTTLEKTNGSVLCQKIGAVVPRPVYTYTCYTTIPASLAESHYALVTGAEMRVSFGTASSPNDGVETIEKKMPNLICRKSRAISPNAKFTYTCYMNKSGHGGHNPQMMAAF